MINHSTTIHTSRRIEKSWGYELWIHNDSEYCGKLLVFEKAKNKFSMHYHIKKKETWYVQTGSFQFSWIETNTPILHKTQLVQGDCVTIPRGLPHQLEALEDGATIFEVSTEHFDSDSYRIYKNEPSELLL